jgi:hypothetical protein
LIETTITTAFVDDLLANNSELSAEQAATQAQATIDSEVSSFANDNAEQVDLQADIVNAALSSDAIAGAIATAETETGTVQVSADGQTVTVDFNAVDSTLFVGGKGIKLLKGSSSGSRIAQLRRNAINQGIKNNSNGDNPKQFVTFSIMRNSLRRARSSGGGKQNAKKQT